MNLLIVSLGKFDTEADRSILLGIVELFVVGPIDKGAGAGEDREDK